MFPVFLLGKKILLHVFHPRLTAADPGHLAPIVVGRLEKYTITDLIPEASSRPFITISIRMSGFTIDVLIHSVRSHYAD